MHKVNKYPMDHVWFVFIAGANVTLAIIASVALTIFGQPNVAWPVCGMVAAVYGVSSTLKLLQKQS